jgi:hypothetical protein
LALLVLGGVVLAGCTGSPAVSAGGSAVLVSPAAGGGQARAQAPGPSGQSAQDGKPLPIPGRQVVRSATIGLRVADLDRAESGVRQVAAAAGGYTAQEDDQAGQASFTLEVPQAKLDGMVGRLTRLGRPTSRTERAQDVTDQLVDVRSRLASQRASVDRVRTLMQRATSIADVASIEGELTKRETDLESLEQQQAELTSQVAMSTVAVRLRRSAVPAAAAPPRQGGFVGGLDSGWHAFLGALSVLLVVLGAILPFLAVLGGLGALLWWLVRRRRVAAVTAGGTGSTGDE